MNDWTPVVMVLLLLVVGVAVWLYTRRVRTTRLRSRFGPEYDRTVQERGNPRRAERELERRTRRVEKLTLRPLTSSERARYEELWRGQQARFVDDPKGAVSEADHLVEEVMKMRGYPVGEFEQRAADISVDHPRVVENYRAGHDIAVREQRGEAGTEDLRKALIYFRALFEELLDDRPMPMGAPAR